VRAVKVWMLQGLEFRASGKRKGGWMEKRRRWCVSKILHV